jgi:hypothetical protein
MAQMTLLHFPLPLWAAMFMWQDLNGMEQGM